MEIVVIQFGDDRLPRQFWERIRVEGSCWIWIGALSTGRGGGGYGFFHYEGRQQYAHRVSYSTFVAPLPEGHEVEVDHVWVRGCFSRACVNPAHLEAVTPQENAMRAGGFAAQNAAKEFCKDGHPLSGDNVRVRDGMRRCLTCQRAYSKRFYEEKEKHRRLERHRG